MDISMKLERDVYKCYVYTTNLSIRTKCGSEPTANKQLSHSSLHNNPIAQIFATGLQHNYETNK